MSIRLTLAHSPDADDAFMFYALSEGKIALGPYEFEHVIADIETLNRAARQEAYDITAVSVFGYAFVADRYLVLECGGSIGDGYGPVVVSRGFDTSADLQSGVVAIPGRHTTAFLTLCAWLGYVPRYVEIPFDRIMDAVLSGRWQQTPITAGVIIHEGQLSYQESGLRCIVDLGQWWKASTGLSLPLGINVIRRALDANVHRDVTEIIRRSVLYAQSHPDEALRFALRFARGLEYTRVRRFVEMYVNEATVRMPEEAVVGMRLLLEKAAELGLVERRVEPEFAQAS